MSVRAASRRSTSVDARVGLVASGQQGAISRAQALRIGISRSGISRRLDAGRWQRSHPGVYVVRGSPSSWMREVWCAFLAVGPTAVITHQTALHLHGVDRVSRRPITLTVPHGGHARLDQVFVHQIDDLGRHPHRVTTLSELPVSTPERAVVDSAPWLGEKHLGLVLDDLLDARTTTLPRVAACFREVVRPGKPGMDKLGRVLEERRGGYVPPQSELERALLMVLAAGGLPEPRRQFGLPGRGAIEGLVDGAYPEAKTILEVDGRAWHARIAAFKHDRLRDLEAARAGWLTVRLVYEQVVHEPREVCAAVRDVLASRGLPCEPRLPRQ